MVQITYIFDDGTEEKMEMVGKYPSLYAFEVENFNYGNKMEIVHVSYL